MDAADAAAAAVGKHKSRRGGGAKDPAPGVASWGDMLLGYTKEKLVAPPAGPPQRVTHRDVDYGQAKLDPIRQVYADPDEDRRQTQAEAEALQKKTALGMEVSHQYDTPYNILNFQSKKPGGDAEQGGARGNRGGWGSGVPYNILNGYSHSVEAEAELRKKEEEELNRTSKRITGESTTAQRGDYNIISNRYHHGHNERCKSEFEASKQNAMDKFYHARSYDPLTGHYYDKLAQERAERDEHQAKQTKAAIKNSRQPPYAKNRLGRGYDITNHVVRDDRAFAEWQAKNPESNQRMSLYEAYGFRKEAEKAAEIQAERTMKRFSQRKRDAPALERGYNIVSNATEDEVTAAQLSAWDRCLREAELDDDEAARIEEEHSRRLEEEQDAAVVAATREEGGEEEHEGEELEREQQEEEQQEEQPPANDPQEDQEEDLVELPEAKDTAKSVRFPPIA